MTSTQQSAARLLSEGLTKAGVRHAFIGGFALNTLGHARSTTDVDVLIDTPVGDARALVLDVTRDVGHGVGLFSEQNNQIVFTPADGTPFPVETLSTGILGLPLQLKTIERDSLPLLHPTVLILTKIKRCVIYAGSTRPASVVKFVKDEGDILFLARLLKGSGETVDFQGYAAENPERLYKVVDELLKHWVAVGRDGNVMLLLGVLAADDAEMFVNV